MHSLGVHETLLNTFMSALAGPCSIKQGQAVLLCVSGGVDSMVLMDLMRRASGAMGLRLGVLHVDHGLRPGESERDAGFVMERCRDASLEFHLVRLGMNPDIANLEEEARRRRYEAVLECKRSHSYAYAATGHTLDDQAETIIYRIIRGTGVRGLAGMEYKRPDGIIRPMLAITRDQVEAYAAHEDIYYVKDKTNDTRIPARNLIRHEIMTLMRRINPQAAHSIAALGRIAQEEGALIEKMACNLERDATILDWGIVSALRLDTLSKAPVGVIKRLLIHQITRMTGELRGVDAVQVDAALDVLKGGIRAHTIRRRVRVCLDGPALIFHMTGQGPFYSMRIDRAGSHPIPVIKKAVHISVPEDTAFPLEIRSYMRGDRMMGKRVSKILGSMKVSRTMRPFWPVLASPEGIVAVAGWDGSTLPMRMIMEEGHGE